MLCLSGFELYSRWVPLWNNSCICLFPFLSSFLVSISSSCKAKDIDTYLKFSFIHEGKTLKGPDPGAGQDK